MDKENIAYLGAPNPITIAVENCSSHSIFITTDNGEIEGEFGHYMLIPAHRGAAKISVKRKTKNGVKVIDTMWVRVTLVRVFAFISGSHEGKIPKNIVWKQVAPSASTDDYGSCSPPFPIDSFTIIVTRGNKMIFYKELHNSKGTRFDEESIAFFKTMQ